MAEEPKKIDLGDIEALDGCDCTTEESDATPDEDLPAAVGGVE